MQNSKTEDEKVTVTFLTNKWTDGIAYEENCAMCQGKGGLSNMIPIPTTKVKLEIPSTKESREAFLCHACLTSGEKRGEVIFATPLPPNCPFSMG